MSIVEVLTMQLNDKNGMTDFDDVRTESSEGSNSHEQLAESDDEFIDAMELSSSRFGALMAFVNDALPLSGVYEDALEATEEEVMAALNSTGSEGLGGESQSAIQDNDVSETRDVERIDDEVAAVVKRIVDEVEKIVVESSTEVVTPVEEDADGYGEVPGGQEVVLKKAEGPAITNEAVDDKHVVDEVVEQEAAHGEDTLYEAVVGTQEDEFGDVIKHVNTDESADNEANHQAEEAADIHVVEEEIEAELVVEETMASVQDHDVLAGVPEPKTDNEDEPEDEAAGRLEADGSEEIATTESDNEVADGAAVSVIEGGVAKTAKVVGEVEEAVARVVDGLIAAVQLVAHKTRDSAADIEEALEEKFVSEFVSAESATEEATSKSPEQKSEGTSTNESATAENLTGNTSEHLEAPSVNAQADAVTIEQNSAEETALVFNNPNGGSCDHNEPSHTAMAGFLSRLEPSSEATTATIEPFVLSSESNEVTEMHLSPQRWMYEIFGFSIEKRVVFYHIHKTDRRTGIWEPPILKRYSDFRELQTQLLKSRLRAAVNMPRIPKPHLRTIIRGYKSKKTIEVRENAFQAVLRYISQHPTLHDSALFERFISSSQAPTGTGWI